MSQFQKLKNKQLAKSKKRAKSENLFKFNARKIKSSFLTPNAKTIFNCLRLAFIKAFILKHFDLKCHIKIETNVLSYTISRVLSQFIFEISLDKIVIKWIWV